MKSNLELYPSILLQNHVTCAESSKKAEHLSRGRLQVPFIHRTCASILRVLMYGWIVRHYICRGSMIPSVRANNVLDIPFSVTCMMRQWLRSMLLSRQTLSAASSQAPGKTLDLLHHLACNHYKWRFRYFKPLFSFLLRPYSPHSSLVLL